MDKGWQVAIVALQAFQFLLLVIHDWIPLRIAKPSPGTIFEPAGPRSTGAALRRNVNHLLSFVRSVHEHPSEAAKTRQQQRGSPFCRRKNIAGSRASYR